MSKYKVAVVRYERPTDSVRKVVEMSEGLDHMPAQAKVFIKPNIVFWTRAVAFPKWGVITTSRIVEDIIILLKEHGIDDITIGELKELAEELLIGEYLRLAIVGPVEKDEPLEELLVL